MNIKLLAATAGWFTDARIFNSYCSIFKAKKSPIPAEFRLKIAQSPDLKAWCEAHKNETPNPIVGNLKVPRCNGSEGELQSLIMEQCRRDAHYCFAFSAGGYVDQANTFLQAWVMSCGKPVDGGSCTDWIISREEGDTPICIFEHFTLFVYAMLISPLMATPGREGWIRQYADYSMKYGPGLLPYLIFPLLLVSLRASLGNFA